MHNGFWELRLDRRMPTIGHLTTWPDLKEVRVEPGTGRGIKRNQPSAAPREAERMPFCETKPNEAVGGMEAVLRNEPKRGGFREHRADLTVSAVPEFYASIPSVESGPPRVGHGLCAVDQ